MHMLAAVQTSSNCGCLRHRHPPTNQPNHGTNQQTKSRFAARSSQLAVRSYNGRGRSVESHRVDLTKPSPIVASRHDTPTPRHAHDNVNNSTGRPIDLCGEDMQCTLRVRTRVTDDLQRASRVESVKSVSQVAGRPAGQAGQKSILHPPTSGGRSRSRRRGSGGEHARAGGCTSLQFG